jgi:hypothetical protein
MDKENRNSALGLFALSLICSWSWIVTWIYDIPLYPSLFTFTISGLSVYFMWRIIRYVAVNTGWKQIGIINTPLRDERSKKSSWIPIAMQVLLDFSLLSIVPIQSYLGRQFSVLNFVISSLLLVFISIKWHEYLKTRNTVKT